MMTSDFDFISPLLVPAKSRIIMLVIDGLGGLPVTAGGQTELEAASSPNLDMLAAEGICGLHQPVGTGITPGSGPSHLALFGYDPRQYQVGRGVLSALGSGFNLQDGDVAARGNFCTVDDSGSITDRRTTLSCRWTWPPLCCHRFDSIGSGSRWAITEIRSLRSYEMSGREINISSFGC